MYAVWPITHGTERERERERESTCKARASVEGQDASRCRPVFTCTPTAPTRIHGHTLILRSGHPIPPASALATLSAPTSIQQCPHTIHGSCAYAFNTTQALYWFERIRATTNALYLSYPDKLRVYVQTTRVCPLLVLPGDLHDLEHTYHTKPNPAPTPKPNLSPTRAPALLSHFRHQTLNASR